MALPVVGIDFVQVTGWMELRFLQIICTFALLAVMGCASNLSHSLWVQEHGGLASAENQDWAYRIAQPLLSRYSVRQQKLTVQVLDSDVPTAFGWPDGRIYVTRGLLAVLDDEEILAVIAHELGHLLDRGRLDGVMGLQGCRRSLDGEIRADALGAELLRQAGISTTAMPRMLERLCMQDQWTPQCRDLLRRRLESLTAPQE